MRTILLLYSTTGASDLGFGTMLSRCTSNLARSRFQARFLGRHRDFKRFQTIFARNTRSTTGQHTLNKVPDLSEVGVRKSHQELIGNRFAAALARQQGHGRLPQAADENRPLRAHDLGANVVTIDRLHIRLDVANRTVAIFKFTTLATTSP